MFENTIQIFNRLASGGWLLVAGFLFLAAGR
jgi:hypothetical protein